MTGDSLRPTSQPPALPAARTRVRSTGGARQTPTSGVAQDAVAPVPPLIGEGPRQYLLGCEDKPAFDGMMADFGGALRPADAIERMWVDEIVDLSWDLHRLRNTRRSVVEKELTARITELLIMTPTGERLMQEGRNTDALNRAARGYVEGDPASLAVVIDAIGGRRLEDALQDVMIKNADLRARLETSIHNTSRLRDGIVSRLYSRRDFIERRSVASGDEQ